MFDAFKAGNHHRLVHSRPDGSLEKRTVLKHKFCMFISGLDFIANFVVYTALRGGGGACENFFHLVYNIAILCLFYNQKFIMSEINIATSSFWQYCICHKIKNSTESHERKYNPQTAQHFVM